MIPTRRLGLNVKARCLLLGVCCERVQKFGASSYSVGLILLASMLLSKPTLFCLGVGESYSKSPPHILFHTARKNYYVPRSIQRAAFCFIHCFLLQRPKKGSQPRPRDPSAISADDPQRPRFVVCIPAWKGRKSSYLSYRSQIKRNDSFSGLVWALF